MKLKHLIATAAFAFASVGASAATLTATLQSSVPGFYSAGFNNTILVAGSFTDTVQFLPTNLNGFADGEVTTISFNSVNNIDFTSVTLNGNIYTLASVPYMGGIIDVALRAPISVTSPIILTIVGSAGGTASYAGTLNLRTVPEPGILALLGIAGLGLALSRRRKETMA